MSMQSILLIVMLVCITLLVILVIALLVVQNKLKDSKHQDQKRFKDLIAAKPKERKWKDFALKAYPLLNETPILRNLLHHMRTRLTLIHAGNELAVRSQSAALTMIVVSSFLLLIVVAFLWTSSWFSRVTIILVAFYLSSVLSDMFIGRVRKQMLYDQSSMILDIRHQYHQTNMVTVSLENSAERSKPLVAVHARQIASILNAADPQEELERYYEIAPNRYMKQLAGVSYKIGEYGDSDIHKGEQSIYLAMLGNIREEIHMDINRRERLDRLLGGIVFVAISPIFMLDPIRNWAESTFPLISNYYNSAWGLYSLVALYIIYAVCFVALRIIKGVDEDTEAIKDEGKWLSIALKKKWVKHFVSRFVPGEHEAAHFKLTEKMKDANSKLTLEGLYLQKIIIAITAFLVIIGFQVAIHEKAKQNILYPNEEIMTGGNQTSGQKQLSKERYAFENALVGELIAKDIPPEQLMPFLKERTSNKNFLPADLDENKYAVYIYERVSDYKQEYYKWYELLIAFALATGCYFLPNLNLVIKSQVRKWEMQNEVDGFNTLSMMLSQFPSISVYELIEWLHRYSYIFERQLLKCLLDYEIGAWDALENLKDDARFVPLERLADRLQVAAELIPVKKAFDDMGAERVFAMDQRREYYERMITRKSTLGKMFGFLPIQATFGLYLLVPFGFMAFQQLHELTVVTSTM